MILLYILLGIITAIIGALPLGASNIAVINATIKHNLKTALKIAITAGISEVLLSAYALNYNMLVKDFFSSNQWLQILISLLLLGIGGFLFFKKNHAEKKKTSKTIFKSHYFSGFFLGLLNPPVLVYWLLVYGIINSNIAMLTMDSSFSVLLLFFLGVYTGKVFTLYLYGKFSLYLQMKFNNINSIVNKFTGSMLFTVGVFQFIKLYFI